MTLPHVYESIDGWFDYLDIYDQALREAEDGARFVELGSWHGRSAAYMGVEIVNSGKRIEFSAVDTWSGDLQGAPAGQGSIRAAFDANMARAGVGDVVRPIQAFTRDAAAQFEDRSLDFVFVDADHTYAGCSEDIRLWLPKVKLGGVIAGHDMCSSAWPGVVPAVQGALPFSRVQIRGSSWWYRVGASAAGAWTGREGRSGASPFIYVPNVNTPGCLDKALRSLGRHMKSVVVIDGSAEGHVPDHDVAVFRPAEKQSFTQMQNWALHEAWLRGCTYAVFMHADAECAEPDAIDRLVGELSAAPPHVAGLFTNYDALAIWRVDALRQVGAWDETFEWYYADNDFYRRIGLAGFHAGTSDVKVHHHASMTIKSDMAEHRRVDAVNAWARAHYAHKWGGEPGKEVLLTPYGIK